MHRLAQIWGKVIPQGKHRLQDVGAWPLSQLGNSGILLHALTHS